MSGSRRPSVDAAKDMRRITDEQRKLLAEMASSKVNMYPWAEMTSEEGLGHWYLLEEGKDFWLSPSQVAAKRPHNNISSAATQYAKAYGMKAQQRAYGKNIAIRFYKPGAES